MIQQSSYYLLSLLLWNVIPPHSVSDGYIFYTFHLTSAYLELLNIIVIMSCPEVWLWFTESCVWLLLYFVLLTFLWSQGFFSGKIYSLPTLHILQSRNNFEPWICSSFSAIYSLISENKIWCIKISRFLS